MALVTCEIQDGIATVVMDDGKANALSFALQAELNAALDRALAEKAILVLTGRKNTFSAGFDLPTLMGGGSKAVEMFMGGFRLAERLLSFPRPVVAAVNGHAMAMGLFLAASADYAIGVDGAYKIAANEVAIGIIVPHSALEICRQRLAPAHFNRATMTSETYTPAAAIAAGLIDRVVAEAELAGEVRNVALRYAQQLKMNAYQATKERVRAPALAALRAAMARDEAELRALFKLG
jgi:enoyl-CoA hydratase